MKTFSKGGEPFEPRARTAQRWRGGPNEQAEYAAEAHTYVQLFVFRHRGVNHRLRMDRFSQSVK